MATDNSQSAAEVVSNGGEGSSPVSQRRSLSSPWASVVRGDPEQNSSPASGVPGSSLSPPQEQFSASENSSIDSSASDAQPENSGVNGDNNAGRPRRPAWNTPLNGAPEPATVMGGAVSWPALSETTRSVPKASSDVSRPVADGSVYLPQVNAPLISQPPQRPVNHNVHSNSSVNNSMPSRARPRNRGGSSSSLSGTSQNAFNQQPLPMPPPPPFHVFEVPYGMVPPVLDNPVRGPRPIGGSHSHAGNDHPQRNNPRRGGGYGPRPRGEGPHPNSHGRREQDRRDVHRPPHYLPPHMGYMPSPLPPGAAPLMAPGPVRVFPGQMGFDGPPAPFIYVPTMTPESFRAVQIGPPPPPFYPPADSLTSKIVKQIDFYFSDDNLAKDKFLRSKMDEHGWVPITLIASFRRIDQLTKDVPLILESLRYSTVVEVQDGKVRRRNEWRKYLLPSGLVLPNSASSTSVAPQNELATSLQNVSLDNNSGTKKTDSEQVHAEMTTGKLMPENLINQSGLAPVDSTAEGDRTVSV
ncbi:la-related protein 1B-like [Andrographis paniculata]|uniref:la-related protein 1B-like n=1 Tax=Andrographis paniculata TaxID=175694 RepID=UPI0021E97F19|nr:la-related protein 1B-like [Andrographis paniculata]